MKKFSIVVDNKNRILQIVGFRFDHGVVVQDIHTKTYLIHDSLLKMASWSERKWFCENTENVNFVTPPPNKEKVN